MSRLANRLATLERKQEPLERKPPAGAIAIVDPATGEILQRIGTGKIMILLPAKETGEKQ